jgi:hypothetical protein
MTSESFFFEISLIFLVYSLSDDGPSTSENALAPFTAESDLDLIYSVDFVSKSAYRALGVLGFPAGVTCSNMGVIDSFVGETETGDEAVKDILRLYIRLLKLVS